MEKSQYHPEAPIINEKFKERFQKDDLAQMNYCRSCRLFLKYIGFTCEHKKINCGNHGRIYKIPFHNQLRITRMLCSLNQVGNNKCSANIYNALMEEINPNSSVGYDKIDNDTLQYWKATQG